MPRRAPRTTSAMRFWRRSGGSPRRSEQLSDDGAAAEGLVMSKRKIAWIVIALVGLLSAAGLVWSIFGSDRLTFTAAELQSRLNQQLPRTVRDVTIERVNVALADNRLALRIALQARVLQQPVSATVSARGVPRYAAHETAM